MKKKKNPIYGDSLKVERNDSLFFYFIFVRFNSFLHGYKSIATNDFISYF